MFKRKQVKEPTLGETKKKKVANNSDSTSSNLWRKIFDEAREAFEKAKYKEAIQLFTRTLQYKPKQITVIDCRAAAYEKNQQFENALKDAASVMAIVPTDSRGYLRAGKILVLQGKYNEAINLYKRALKMVPSTDARYNTIEPLLKNTRNKKKPAKVTDFMKVLPYDLICHIFSYLSFDRRVQCITVCRAWREFAMNWTGMWRDLDFARYKIPQTAMIKYMNYAKGRNVRRLCLQGATANTMLKILKTLITQDCHYIEALELDDCIIPMTEFLRVLRLMGRNLKYLKLDSSPFSFTTIVNEIIPVCPKLTHLSALQCAAETNPPHFNTDSKLQLVYLSLSFAESAALSIDGLNTFLNCCPQLITFELISVQHHFTDFGSTLQNKCLDLENITFTHSAHRNPKLDWLACGSKTNVSEKGWRLFDVSFDPTLSNVALGTIFKQHHSTLEKLSLVDCSSITNEMSHFDYHSYPLKRLDTLSIQSCIGVDEAVLQTLLASTLRLKQLVITKSIAVNDSLTESVAPLLQQLEYLDISDCPNMTGRGLKKWIDANKASLRKLILNNCHRINTDTTAWAVKSLGRHVVECKYS
ncbi:hypothetical protein K501DRAFT_251671 [Backusella circina FSU 941]|nr:hypothetical protein K501DRAFT_251671 [Backusella circina FSU 941]